MRRHDGTPLPPEGLWISPKGRKIPVVEHMLAVHNYPEEFGLSRRDVAGASIPALTTICQNLIRRGWVRFRYTDGTYSFEVDDVERREAIIESVMGGEGVAFERVILCQATPRREHRGSVEDFRWGLILLDSHRSNPDMNSWRFT